MLGSEVVHEELVQGLLICLAERVSRDAVGHDFDDASDVEACSCAVGNSVVGEKTQAQLVSLEDLLEKLDDL